MVDKTEAEDQSVGKPRQTIQSPDRLYKAPTDNTKPQQTIESPDRLYKAPERLYKAPERL